MPLIKVACFVLNFLNLKSFLRHLFFGVASCLSTLWAVLDDSSAGELLLSATKLEYSW